MIQNSYSTSYLNIKTDNTFNNFRQSTQENKKNTNGWCAKDMDSLL